jgi:hypothetical protein
MQRACWIVSLAAVGATALGQENLVRNGDFTRGTAEWSLQQDATCAAAVVDGGGGGQAKALRLTIKTD